MINTAQKLADLSQWIDDANLAAGRNPEALTWGRLAKLQEEAGEVVAAFIGVTGQNPRKGITHTMDNVQDEVLDVIITGLAALEHLTGNRGDALQMLFERVEYIKARADQS